MTIFTTPNRRVRGLSLQDFPAPSGDYLTARTEEEFLRTPTRSANRISELNRAAGVPQELARINRDTMPHAFQPDLFKFEPLSPYLSAEEATSKGSIVGVSFNEPTRSEVVDIIVERKKRELALQSITARSPGLGTTVTGFGLGFVAQALDPLNIASAFVPVVREARFLQAARAVGPTRARLLRGVAEGTVGATLVEPFVLAAATQEQADYDMVDSLLNIAFGAALGGGLHWTAGTLSDAAARTFGGQTLAQRLQAMEPEIREQAMRSAIAQMVEGREVTLEPLLGGNPLLYGTSLSTRTTQYVTPAVRSATMTIENLVLSDTPATSSAPAAGKAASNALAEQLPEPKTMVPYKPQRKGRNYFQDEEKAYAAARKEGADVRVVKQDDGTFTLAKQSELEPVRDPDGTVTTFDTRRAAQRFIDARRKRASADSTGDKLDIVPIGRAGERKYAIVRGATDAEVKDLSAAPERTKFADRPQEQFQPVGDASPFAVPQIEQSLDQRIAQAVAVSRDPKRIAIADFRAAEDAEVVYKESKSVKEDTEGAQTEITDAEESARELKEALDISDEQFAKITEQADEEIAEAKAFGKALKAAALCDLRR